MKICFESTEFRTSEHEQIIASVRCQNDVVMDQQVRVHGHCAAKYWAYLGMVLESETLNQ